MQPTQRVFRGFGASRRCVVALALVTVPVLLSAEASPEQARLVEAYGQVPLAFEANTGQTDPQVAFLARGAGYALFLTPKEAVLSLRSGSSDAGPSVDQGQPAVLRLKCRGANPAPRVSGLDPQATRSNHFIGNDPARWRSDVPHFGKVRYEDVYPGIDLVYYGRQRQLEFDFVVRPGADPRRIGLDFDGADRIETDAQGDLLVHVGAETLRQHKPVVYQERDGERQPVAGAYVVEGQRRAAFRLGGYDHSRPLVIDPVLVYSTYLGGGLVDAGHGIAVDGSGNVYVTGHTQSTNFPTANAIQGANGGTNDAFVAKLNVAGSALVYSTYLGGSGLDRASAIGVDASGNAYVAGDTSSTDFPTVNPLQGANAGGYDAFVAKLNAAGSALVYCTYLGGAGSEYGWGIAVDGSGNAHTTGFTASPDFPTVNPLQGTHAGGLDAFVAGLNATGSALTYSSFLGGSDHDQGAGIVVDGSGSAYVTGITSSTDFPTVNPLQGTCAGEIDAFVAKLNAAGSALVYSTYLGGSDAEFGLGIAVDGGGDAYITGFTSSTDFPTASPLQGTHAGSDDVFVAKLNSTGSALAYSTYLGGSHSDAGYAIAVDGSGSAYVTGHTYSIDFPTAHPLQATRAGIRDVFVAKLEASGSALAYSTHLGGSGDDFGRGIAVDGAGNAYVAGETSSTDFPTANPLQATNHGSYDAFVAKIGDVTKGDVDGDGHLDLFFRSNADGTQNKVWLMNGVARAFEAAVTPDAASPDWRIRGADDFNADNHNDLVFWNQATGQVEFWLMNGTARAGDAVPLTGGAVLPVNWDLAATADFNHDGRPDIVWRNVTSQKVVVWTMNGTAKLGNLLPTPDQAADASWALVAAMDYNADRNPDFLWYNQASGKLATWYLDAALVRTSGQLTTPPSAGSNNWKVVASGDYSRGALPIAPSVSPSGSPDIVWRNEISGNQVVWHMDFNSARVQGQFTNPAANAPALDWTIVGPR